MLDGLEDAGGHVRRRAHLERDALPSYSRRQLLIVEHPEAMTQPLRLQRVEGAADAVGAGRLARMGNRVEALRQRGTEDLGIGLGRMPLVTAESEGDDAVVAEADGRVLGERAYLDGEAPGVVEDQADGHAEVALAFRQALE